jgi:hypothetical protein
MSTSLVLKNSLNEATLWASTNTTFVIAGNNSVSNVSYVNSDNLVQNVASASIRKIICSTNATGAVWTISRGGNVAWQCSGNFTFDFQAHGMPLTQDAAANVVVGIAGGAGTILIDISKVSNY